MTEPTIPLIYSDKLYVSLATTVQEIDKNTDYPTGILKEILSDYCSSRDNYLRDAGFTSTEIKEYEGVALDSLMERLEGRRDHPDDFELWNDELKPKKELDS